MTETLSKTLNHGDFDSVFQEVSQPELVNWTTEGELRLFHLLIRNNKINVEDLKKFLYMSIGDYVFSRAKIERFSQSGNRDAVIAQAQRALKKNGGADIHGAGSELREVLNYSFMEEKLHAPKLMSRIEIDTDGKQYGSYALRFADLLSKSNHPTRSDAHKMWAQEIVILLNQLYRDDALVKLYAGSVFSSAGNHLGMKKINANYTELTTFERIFAQYRNDYLTIPADTEKHFFSSQKEAYDHLSDPCFSYSGPTSMGKSFIMRMFIKDEIVLQGAKKNYALIVPTKALINEVRSSVINDLGANLEQHDYHVVSAASDVALEEKHYFIFVLTPERLLYLLISKPDIEIDYLFLDEAHKLSGKNSRGPFYYKVVDMLLKRTHKPHFIFASPNIPNPQVYLRLMNDIIENGDENKLASTYSPVIQVKFLMDFVGGRIDVYNEKADKRIKIANIKQSGAKLNDILVLFEAKNLRMPPEDRTQTIVYYNGRARAIAAAKEYTNYAGIKEKNDPELDALSKDISQEVHGDYYLADMIKKALHIILVIFQRP